MPTKEKQAVPVTSVYPIRDIEKPDGVEPVTGGWASGLPIALDLGTYQTRVGYASESSPSHVFYTQVAKYRDRKINRTYSLVGNDIYLDSNGRQNMRSPFDGSVVSNWEFVETIMDYCFAKILVQSQGFVNNPVVFSEMPGCPSAQRKSFNEILFEGYGVPSVAFGIDSLFSFKYNQGQTGLVVSSANESTHIIPVVNGKGILSLSKRLNWGGRQASTYLQNLLSLKYPMFPTKISSTQSTLLVHDHCYVSTNYAQEVESFLDFESLENRERIIEAPFVETVVVEKSEEELARLAEKRKESGMRLQEQAAKARLEKLIVKERQLEEYRELQQQIEAGPKKDVKKTLDGEGFKDEAQLQKTIADLEKSIRHARKQDVGDEEEEEVPTFPLVEVPDDQLNEDQIKEKRRQRLMKANYDARMRAKEEKKLEKIRQEEEAQKDVDWREQDFEGWLLDHRDRLHSLYNNIRERKKLKEELSNRKSHAAQLRMKSIAALASDSTKKRRRGKGDDDADDTFGADDADWGIYRNITNASDTEEEEEEQRQINELKEQLTSHDPEFKVEDYTGESLIDWKDSLVHMFLRGPHEYDLESQAQQHQMNLNIERIRVPEVLFQPSIAGVDQAGIVEIVDDLLRHIPGSSAKSNVMNTDVTSNIFLTGGQAHFKNFDDRLRLELRSILPVGTPLRVRKADNPSLDAWKGMAQWATTQEFQQQAVTRQEYQEMGSEYMKEHGYGNSYI